ncbi:MAG: 2,3,4,5-tetrahydropyridine-2,6-dicarboxylate N-succinyltransferase, partial [Bacteroidetes bacterium]|nr:2,3,4,5-tetrahydropyridine-2,6-dicarboxylate N-succinyltransferase [Bacteroidota bacterium]
MKELIEAAWNDRDLLKQEKTKEAIRSVIAMLDRGELRVAEPIA